LEKITDLQMTQGFVMRYFDLRNISVETAGQSGPGSLISLLGVKDTESFRREVLDQRDRMGGTATPAADSTSEGDSDSVLLEIRDELKRTTQLLEELVEQGASN
jgi:putative membrane protein